MELEQEPLGKQLAVALKGLRTFLDEQLGETGSSLYTYLVLRQVDDNPGVSQRDLAERLGIEGPTLTHHLDRLSERGLVCRVRSVEDRRVSSAALTAEGRAHLRHVREIADRSNAELRSLFSDTEWLTLCACLERITDRYGRHTLDHDRTRSA